MCIPVINNNHDFYWEGGSRHIDKKENGVKKGPRDFFFTNSHVGKIFSLMEVLYPWESRSWMNVNINQEQSTHVIHINGHNPANVIEISTAVDTSLYFSISKQQKINALIQLEKILSKYEETLIVYPVEDVIKNKMVDEKNPSPLLIGSKTEEYDKFLHEKIILLQFLICIILRPSYCYQATSKGEAYPLLKLRHVVHQFFVVDTPLKVFIPE